MISILIEGDCGEIKHSLHKKYIYIVVGMVIETHSASSMD